MISPSFSISWGDSIEGQFTDVTLVQLDQQDSISKVVKKESGAVLEVYNPYGAPWAYFKLPNKSNVLGNYVIVEVKVLADSDFEFWIEYDSSDEQILVVENNPGAFKRTEQIEIKCSQKFETVSFLISDGLFEKRINGADFRVVAGLPSNRSITISEVKVSQAFENRKVAVAVEDYRNYYKNIAKSLIFESVKDPICSIIIPVKNKFEYTVQCLFNLKKYTKEDYEVIIVDDYSDPEDLNVIKSIKGVLVYENKECLGFAKSCNIGAKNANTEKLLFLNNDTMPLRNWLSPMLDALEQKDVGVVGSKLMFPGTNLIQHAGVAFNEYAIPFHLNLNMNADSKNVKDNRFLFAVTGASFLTKASLFKELKGFDEIYKNGLEDIDYCLRVVEAGYLPFYCAESKLYHYESVSEGRRNYLQEVYNVRTFQNRWLPIDVDSDEGENSSCEQVKQVAKLIAFYDLNFKDNKCWSNITKAKKLFSEHLQPRKPIKVGQYQDLTIEEFEHQVELATKYGIYGFCFLYHWNGSIESSQELLNTWLSTEEVIFPFCLCWNNDDIYLKKNWDEEFIESILVFLLDSRYIKVHGKPLIIVKNIKSIGDSFQVSKTWRKICRENGIGDIVLGLCRSIKEGVLPLGFDVFVEYPPESTAPNVVKRRIDGLDSHFTGEIYDYYEYTLKCRKRRYPKGPRFNGVMMNWDNTPTKGLEGSLFYGFTNYVYESWLLESLNNAEDISAPHEPYVFLNSWNDWVNGNYIEPDEYFRKTLLESTQKIIKAHQALDAKSLSNRYKNACSQFLKKMSEITSPEQVYRCEIENNLSKFIERVELEQIAIILHVFDIDIFHKLLKKLICLNHVNFKLYISSSVDKIDIITELLNKYHLEDYMIFKTKNLGEDIRPFLKVLPEVMKNKHKVIMKIYAQKEDGVNETESYLSHLYNFLLANDNIKVLLKNLLTFDDVGMIGPEEFVRSVDEFMFNKSETVFDLASKLGVSREEALSSKFVAGRMFICKSDVLSPLLKLSFSDKDFEKDKREIDGGLVHGLERVLGICLVRSNNQILSLPMGKFKA